VVQQDVPCSIVDGVRLKDLSFPLTLSVPINLGLPVSLDGETLMKGHKLSFPFKQKCKCVLEHKNIFCAILNNLSE
jgi:hypothetical protein